MAAEAKYVVIKLLFCMAIRLINKNFEGENADEAFCYGFLGKFQVTKFHHMVDKIIFYNQRYCSATNKLLAFVKTPASE